MIREVRPEEHAVAGQVTALAYREFLVDAKLGWPEYVRRVADVAGRAGHTRVLVALDGDRIVGSATLETDAHVEPDWREALAPDEAHLRMLGVDPAQRRQGAGRALVQACISLAKEAGKRRLTLETTAEMQAAQAMYHSLGFRHVGPREVAHGLCFDSYELSLDVAADAAAPL